ncbi:MAG: single-stranded DNA-binding protein [Candidatus Eremiobacteraeota bacterium]|nr:single-stranded DNA-binding protein [Candidatus Eremiobacteraeota bacterium]
MASLNRIILIGRVAKVPELRYTPSGAAVANFRLAVDRKFSKNNETDFIPIVAWRRLAEICNEYLTKGKLVAIEGSLQVRTYEDKDGQKRTAFDVVADEMQMLDRGTGGGGAGGSEEQRRPNYDREPVGAPNGGGGYGHGGGYPPTDDGLGIDDIPF